MNCRKHWIIGAIGLFIVSGYSVAAAQPGYDSSTVTKIQGRVLSIQKTPAQDNRGHDVRLILLTTDAKIPVYLGPESYLEKQTPNLAVNDFIIVTGSRVNLDGKPAIIAAQIQKGIKVLRLRNAKGRPLWTPHGNPSRR